MTGIDELIRDVLSADAAAQPQPADLAARSMKMGQRIRRRRHVGLSVAAVTAVVAMVGGSVAISDAVGHRSTEAVISPAAQPGTPWWKAWSTTRVFGTKPSDAFLNDPSVGNGTIYASGTMTDATNFVVFQTQRDAAEDHIAEYTQGWNNVPDFGQAVSEGPKAGADAEYLTLESPTFQSGQASNGSSQWLVVVAKPDTTAASYSADGTTWQPMQVQNGIAVLELPGIAPQTSQIRLSDAAGQYVEGPLAG